MSEFNPRNLAAVLTLFGLTLLGGCASNGEPDTPTPNEPGQRAAAPVKRTPSSGLPRISLEAGAHQTLGEAFRYLGETYGGGAALIGGLEDDPAPADGLDTIDFVKGFERLAEQYASKIQVMPHYVFLYPEGFEVLETISLEDKVAPRFNTTQASFAIGAGTDLYNAFALLSTSLQMTIVADNLIGETWCGETFLEDAPVSAIVEAILKTARLAPGAFEVESTSEYMFIRSTNNKSQAPGCINRGELTTSQEALLKSSITLHLPDTGTALEFQSVATPLKRVLPTLSSRLGIPVTATEAVAALPVNVSVFQNVTVETALDLLVRQWLLPRYGYRLDEAGLQFCER